MSGGGLQGGRIMLVLTRRVNETIMIGDDIMITVVSVQGHGPHAQVRLGITAPRETTVLRREVYEASRRGEAPPVANGHAPAGGQPR
jgi:carbon storage regulator